VYAVLAKLEKTYLFMITADLRYSEVISYDLRNNEVQLKSTFTLFLLLKSRKILLKTL